MPDSPRILAFSGSSRRESLNSRLLHVTADAARDAGASVTVISLRDYELPLYDGDLEDASGLPEAAARLITLLTAHDGLLIASPEYNSMMTPLLKNTIDWCSRADDNPFEGRVAAIVSASPGAFGGIRSLTQMRQLLTHLGMHVVPATCAVGQANTAFDDQGRLTLPRSQKAVAAVARSLVETTRRLRPA
jgi:chromate reductase, NAD(P)H dehydrogenase (quinone)